MDNKSLIKWLLILASAPIWVPFLRALWQDLKKALREEGGLWGPTPTEREIDEIRRAKAREEPEVVHEPHERRGARSGFGGARRGASAGGGERAGARDAGAGRTLRRDDRARGL